jgi:shikimate dehydrogenase
MITAATRLAGLVGWPVAGSLSPRMHNAAFAARGLDWAYVALPVEPGRGRLGDAVRGLAAVGFAGANVTAPYKQDVVAHCDEVDDAVAQSGSANTLVFRERRAIGSSTDAAVLADVEASTVAVIGSGGAARAFAAALEGRGAVVHTFSRRGMWPPDTTGVELVVHATPVVDELVVEPTPGQVVIDLPYRSDGRPTVLVAAAQEAGCRVIDGLDVLVRQGAASFELWTGIAAPVEVMQAAVRPSPEWLTPLDRSFWTERGQSPHNAR